MINSNEVRRGNLVKYDDRIFEIDSIAEVFPTLNTSEFGIGVVDWNNIEPIPLTEDILLKCGFKKEKNLNGLERYDFDEYAVYLWEGGSLHFIYDNTEFPHITDMNYLHELQNFFSSIRKELIFKL